MSHSHSLVAPNRPSHVWAPQPPPKPVRRARVDLRQRRLSLVGWQERHSTLEALDQGDDHVEASQE